MPDRAIAAWTQVARLEPDSASPRIDLARVLFAAGKTGEALAAADAALKLAPDDPHALAWRGVTASRIGRGAEALPCLHRAIAGNPTLEWPLRRLVADSLLQLGDARAAIAALAAVEDELAGNPDALRALGRLYQRAGDGARAERAWLRLLDHVPGDAVAAGDLAQLYFDHAKFSKARDVAERVLALNPRQPDLWNTLALSQATLGLVRDSLASYRKVLELAPKHAVSHSNMLLSMHYSTDVGAMELAEEHRRWGQLHAPPAMARREFANDPAPGRRLRIGYLSPDFRRHSVAFFFETLLDHRDREHFDICCYGEVRSPDDVTRRIQGKVDGYRTTVGRTDRQVVEQIEADGIDVLIDLAGHTGGARTTVLGYKPAPVQVTWCGYPDTTGIAAVDYRITDWLADPQGVEDFYTETLCRLPGAFLCFRPPESLPAVGPPPSAAGRPVTFGSFNREFKCSQETYDMWCRILHAVPDARMLLKSIGGADPGTRKMQFAEFTRRGIEPGRIEMAGFIPGQADHLAMYGRVDIALDTYPYHGTTTTLDSLLMSVPVITLAGYNHASRVGVSLLGQVGLSSLVARTPDEYVSLAVGLARSPSRIAGYHATLRSRLFESPLCDGRTFTRRFETALRGMWCRWARSQGSELTPAESALAEFKLQ